MDVIFDPNRQVDPAAGSPAAAADLIKDGDQKTFAAESFRQPLQRHLPHFHMSIIPPLIHEQIPTYASL